MTVTARQMRAVSLSQSAEGRLGFFGSLAARFRLRVTVDIVGIIA